MSVVRQASRRRPAAACGSAWSGVRRVQIVFALVVAMGVARPAVAGDGAVSAARHVAAVVPGVRVDPPPPGWDGVVALTSK